MTPPSLPINEDTRLKTLVDLNILDTPAEERFDRLTRMAKRTLATPIAVVSLVDKNRQWFKSIDGLDVCETSREISFCGHAINNSDIFIVSDATKDERFSDNPLVVNDPKIRFYAGVPLKAINGQTLGTFCIIDTKPRTLSLEEIEILKDLALTAEREISIVHLATIDELTKIYNRRGFMMLANNLMKLSTRNKMSACIVYLDLNNFKLINDKCGHSEGDRVLATFAYTLTKLFRGSDICARIGGDEFAVLLCGKTANKTEQMILRLQESLADNTRAANFKYAITFSYGVVEYDPIEHDCVKKFLNAGDSLMYHQKKEVTQ